MKNHFYFQNGSLISDLKSVIGGMGKSVVFTMMIFLASAQIGHSQCNASSPDTDGDGVCNTLDVCPNMNDALIGSSCDDGDPCTTNDRWTTSCDCEGTPSADDDNDGVCNQFDQCPDFDDDIDIDNDGIPYCIDDCVDVNQNGICDDVDTEPITDKLKVHFSLKRGFYDNSIQVTLIPNRPGTTIRYSLGADPSCPSAGSGTIYTGPINVTKSGDLRTLKAIGVNGNEQTKVYTHSYIFTGFELPSVVFSCSPYSSAPGESETTISFEFITPAGHPLKSVQEYAGTRTSAGGVSRGSSDKVYFRSDYGAGTMREDLFSDNNYGPVPIAKKIDQLFLRSDHLDGTMMNQIISHDALRSTGELSPAGRYVHMYQNGSLDEVRHLQERPEGGFLEAYTGFDKSVYDAFAGDQHPNLASTVRTGWAETKRVINIESFGHFLVNQWIGNANDFWDNRNYRTGGAANLSQADGDALAWHYFNWDLDLGYDGGGSGWDHSAFQSPEDILVDVRAHDEFKLQFADIINCGLENEGPLSERPYLDRVLERADQLEVFLNNDNDYGTNVNSVRSDMRSYIPERVSWLRNELRSNNYSSDLREVTYSVAPGTYDAGQQLTLNNPNGSGTIYYTLDGTDVRTEAGTLRPAAQRYNGPITLGAGVNQIIARVHNPNAGNIVDRWSSTCGAKNYYVDQQYSNIVINEIHYSPPGYLNGADVVAGKNFEFIELKNIGNKAVDLVGSRFSKGIELTIENSLVLQPGGFAVFAEDAVVFEAFYGFAPDGVYSGQLENKGEKINLKDPLGYFIDTVRYDSKKLWDEATDSTGYSLELLHGSLDNSNGLNWFRSDNERGTPRAENSRTCANPGAGIVINEINYNSNEDQLDPGDWVELHNPTGSAVNLSGWTLYDSGNEFVLPSNTTLAPEGYLVLVAKEDDFKAAFPNISDTKIIGELGFGLSSSGERLTLFDANKCFADYVIYNDKAPWATEPDGEGPTLSLLEPSLDNALPESWESSLNMNDSYVNGSPSVSNICVPGQPCDDGIACTYNDTFDADCNCVGTLETADADNDGVCDIADICQGFNDNLIGTPCDDGDDCTIGETYDADCGCSGGVAEDIDNDGICDALDLCNGDLIGTTCEDGDPCTTGETYDANCNCTGGTTGDADNDGVCDALDLCNNLDDNLIGQTCDDNNPSTEFDMYNANTCGCSGIIVDEEICSSITSAEDDAEETISSGSVTVSSSDIDIISNNLVGLRFRNMAIPTGVTVTNATVQFTADEDDSDAISITIQAEAADNSATFSTSSDNLSSRTKTTATVTWEPTAWNAAGQAGAAQQTVDISSLIQEVIDRPGFASGNAISIFFETNSGNRVAESFNTNPAQAAELCISYRTAECQPGYPCDDDNAATENDVLQDDCSCAGIVPVESLIAITGINYHPLASAPYDEENFEFLFITNFDDKAESVAGDTIKGLSYVFPAGTTIAPDETIMLTKDMEVYPEFGFRRLLLTDGKLSNGGEDLTIVGTDGGIIDFVEYDDETPWSVLPDGLGYYLRLKNGGLNPNTAARSASDLIDNSLAESWEAVPLPSLLDPCLNNGGDDDFDGICNPEDVCPNFDDHLIGTACDDGNPCTVGETYDANCGCSGGVETDTDNDGICDELDDCNNNLAGTTCDDGNPCTVGETYDNDCNCTGGVSSDSDGDGVCDNEDICDGLDDNLIGTPCDDGDICTVGETYDANCGCTGGVVSDYDNDGICDELDDCDDVIGLACDDGDPCTVGETWNSDCNCTGGVALDTDGDGVCDLQDICEGLDDSLIGTACDDGNPLTEFDMYTADNCGCAGIIISQEVCTQISTGNDDAEELSSGFVTLTSSDLDMTSSTVAGLRFQNINVPNGATITNATIQFASDETDSGTTTITISAEAADDASAFTTTSGNITARTKTTANVTWSPAPWTGTGDVTAAQKTVDLAPVIQELVNRPGFAAGNSIVIIIESDGSRVAETYNSSAQLAPQLCISYGTGTCRPGYPCDDNDATTENDVVQNDCSCLGTPIPDCPALSANIGDLCDDGDATTENDVVTASCECIGTSIYDCPTLSANVGDSCNDGNAGTENDVVTANCGCVGTVIYDCPALAANIGDTCNDGDSTTENDVVTANCGCAGTVIYDCPALTANIGDTCNDGDSTTENDVVTANCGCAGTVIPPTFDCPTLSANVGDSCNDGDVTTENDVVTANCGCAGTSIYDCPALLANIGDTCDDGDATTENDAVTTDCGCAGTPVVNYSGLSITGINYNPLVDPTLDEEDFEFLFITNYTTDATDISGDSIKGISYVFPAGTMIDGGETIMVTKDMESYPNFTYRRFLFTDGKLSNGGEELIIKTTDYTMLDSLEYDDKAPWEEAADGNGFYLQLKAPTLDNTLPENWEAVALPPVFACTTNGGDADGDGVCANADCDDNNAAVSFPGDLCDDGDATTENDVVGDDCNCTGTPIATTSINITGINYNPLVDASLDGDDFEFLLITNYGTQAESVAGDTIKGISYVFPAGVTIGAGETIMLTKDMTAYPDLNFPRFLFADGKLSNGGEDLTIKRTNNAIIDFVEYDDKAPWAVEADGMGSYLTLISPELDNTVATNWTATPLPALFGACADNGGDADFDGVCTNQDCDDNNPAVSYPGDLCDDGDATTENDVVDANCNCAGTPIATTSISITGINYNPLVDATLDEENFEFLFITNYGTEAASVAGDSIKGIGYVFPAGVMIAAGETIMLTKDMAAYPGFTSRRFLFADGKLSNGGEDLLFKKADNTIVDFVEYDDKAPWAEEADGNGSYLQLISPELDNTIATNWIAAALPDLGISNLDCPTLSANIGDTCDDGDANTENDVVTANCTCAGTVIPPTFDCPALSANIGDTCDDGDATTENDVVTANCACEGTVIPPTFDCPALSANIGDTCDDNDANTENDVVTANCNCEGTPIQTGGCQATYTVTGLQVLVENITAPITSVQVLDAAYNAVFSCNDWVTVCGTTETITLPAAGTYYVQIQTFEDWTTPICQVFETIVVNGTDPCADNGGDSDGDGICDDVDPCDNNLEGTTCDDGDANTINDVYDANCNCAGVPATQFDCPALAANIGDTCDDGDATTENDVVTANCGCEGTPIQTGGCDIVYNIDGTTITIENLNAPITSLKILDLGWNEIFSCNDWGTICNATESITVPTAGDYYIQVQTYQDWSTPICNIFETFTATQPTTGGVCENVTDGGMISGEVTICPGETPAAILNATLPSGGNGTMEYIWLASTTGCPNSLSDIIQNANASTYQPEALTESTYFRRYSRRANCNELIDWIPSNCVLITVADNGDCAPTSGCSANYYTTGNVIFIDNIEGNIRAVKVLDNAWNPIFSCDDWTTTCGNSETINVPSSGTYWVQIQTYEDWSTPVCNILESVNVGNTLNRTASTIFTLDAAVQHNVVSLDWTNNTGSVASHFELERSIDGETFESLGDVLVENIDDKPTIYSRKDNSPLVGYNFYRVKMVNLDGNHIYSNTKRMTIADLEDFGIFPNPAVEYTNVSLNGFEGSDIEIQVIDQFGKRIKVIALDNVADATYSIDLNNINSGIYSLWIFADGKKPVGKKLIVNKL